jgi:hypothetical protein
MVAESFPFRARDLNPQALWAANVLCRGILFGRRRGVESPGGGVRPVQGSSPIDE